MNNLSETLRVRVAAVTLLALFAGVAMLSVAMYQKAFTKTETITVQADRAGLQMRTGTVIKYKGVDVGKVKSAKPTSDGQAVIELAMFPDMLDSIPANVEVSLEQLTAFGNKGVVLRPRTDGADGQVVKTTETLQAGSTLKTDHIAVEANQIFENLESVLTTLEPAKVNAVLTGLSTAVEGKGDRLGRSLETADRYLTQINNDMPALQRDFNRGADVLDIYSDASGDLLGALSNVTTTAGTLTEVQPKLATMLDAVTSFAGEGTTFTRANKNGLDQVLATAIPTTSLLAKYSPQTECTVRMGAESWRLTQGAYGRDRPGSMIAELAVLPQGGVAYDNPDDLPDVSLAIGPQCWEYPTYQGQYLPTGYGGLDTGTSEATNHTYDEALSLNGQPLGVYILGDLSRYLPGLAGGAQ